jgi:hypothetical protein
VRFSQRVALATCLVAGLLTVVMVQYGSSRAAATPSPPTFSTREISVGAPAYSGVWCTSTTNCVASATSAVLVTDDGGVTWSQFVFNGMSKGGVACASADDCMVAGGTIIATTDDGGATWVAHALPDEGSASVIACTSTSICVAMGGNQNFTTSNGGVSWTESQIPNITSVLGLTCPTMTNCIAAGSEGPESNQVGVILQSGDAGQTWTAEASPPAWVYSSVSCSSGAACLAFGSDSERRPVGNWKQRRGRDMAGRDGPGRDEFSEFGVLCGLGALLWAGWVSQHRPSRSKQ